MAFARPAARGRAKHCRSCSCTSVADVEGPPDHPFTRPTRPPFKLDTSTWSLQPSLDDKLVDASLPSSSYKVWWVAKTSTSVPQDCNVQLAVVTLLAAPIYYVWPLHKLLYSQFSVASAGFFLLPENHLCFSPDFSKFTVDLYKLCSSGIFEAVPFLSD